MNALGNRRELTGGNGEVEQTILIAYPMLHAPFNIKMALRVFVLIKFFVQFGKVLIGVILARMIVANAEETVHTASILRKSLPQLFTEGCRIHLRSCITNNSGIHRE